MESIQFPKMFTGNSSVIIDDNDAILNCLHLLLSTESGELFGDPEYGIKRKAYCFNQNNYILKDILIDEIYTKICIFYPKIFLQRKNITITQSGSTLYAHIRCKNKDNFETNTYDLVLYGTEENK